MNPVDYIKYPKETIKGIAERIDTGMICFLNTDTMEIESVLGESYNAYGDTDFEDLYREVYDKVENWEHCVRIDPPESRQSFKIMEDFIKTCIPDGDPIKERLWSALSGRKPFRNFKYIIDDSPYRQCWFDFKQIRMEDFVLNQLL